ncbi:MAG: 16S rRNA (cytosine(1402)-N(4))-methyltransferase RsmH [Bdellovibrionales bacterium]|nr:16S rRNA (cytosine(1402)-N(4))-methyltransferase RsmH [Bdellovibrionales bacterium]
MEHIPVLFDPIMEFVKASSPKVFLDATFGRGGHARGIFDHSPEVKIFAMDQDHEAIQYAQLHFSKELETESLVLIHDNFKNIKRHFSELKSKYKIPGFDGILVDLGVSSPQLDNAERGFSFYNDGPLDMRMDQRQELTAADIVNNWSEEELVQLFKELGEVFKPYRVAKAIVHDRKEKLFERTSELSGLIERIEGWKRKGHHPATKYFLALRLEVNKELEIIKQVISDFIECLNEEGLLMIISFHSLEDRIIKYSYKDMKSFGEIVNKKVIQEKWEVQKNNPRARSAKLRVFRKKTSQGEANEQGKNFSH